ncbi:MAG: hypothetical protein H6714_09915 [Myxococcales bacterium]|nr:hypothetical protein [Myxococcales bacterium]
MKIPHLTRHTALFSVVAVILSASTVSANGREFSPQERHLLDSGKLVKRQVSQRRGNRHLFGGTSWQVIDADADYVWRVINDVRKYPAIFPHLVEAKLLAKRGASRTVYLEHASGPFHVSYALKGVADVKHHDLNFKLDTSRPRDIDAAWGFFSVRPYGAGRSILTYGVMLDIGSGLLRGLLRDKIRGTLLHIPRNVRQYIHQHRS